MIYCDSLLSLFKRGIDFEELSVLDSQKVRQKFDELYYTALPWLPKGPLPHGFFWDFRWDFVPLEYSVDLDKFMRGNLMDQYWLVFESPRGPVVSLSSPPDSRLYGLDSYVISEKSGDIICLSHEYESAFVIPKGCKIPRDQSALERRSAEKGRPIVFPDQLDLAGMVSSCRRLLVQRLRERGVYLPRGLPSPKLGDRLYNYFPAFSRFDPKPCLDEFLFNIIERWHLTVAFCESPTLRGGLIRNLETSTFSNVDHCYFVNWPECDSLVAVHTNELFEMSAISLM